LSGRLMRDLSAIVGVLRPELHAPRSDSLVGDDNPPLRQEILNIAEAQRESMV
jgi:hypothetical protein